MLGPSKRPIAPHSIHLAEQVIAIETDLLYPVTEYYAKLAMNLEDSQNQKEISRLLLITQVIRVLFQNLRSYTILFRVALLARW